MTVRKLITKLLTCDNLDQIVEVGFLTRDSHDSGIDRRVARTSYIRHNTENNTIQIIGEASSVVYQKV